MRCVIFLSGSILDDQRILDLVGQADCLICADGGLRHARRMAVRPDLLVGDLDSVQEDDLAWMQEQNVPVRLFPADKDETDAELAILAGLERLSLDQEGQDIQEVSSRHEIILAGALGDRPDHVLATQLLAAEQAARLARYGCRFRLTDGRSDLFVLCGGQTLQIERTDLRNGSQAVSAIPVSSQVSGLTYEGLEYPLQDAVLKRGSTRGVSNRLLGPAAKIRLRQGILLIVVTPE